MTTIRSPLLAAALLGAATGLRTTVGLASVATSGAQGRGGILSHPATRPIAALAVGTELARDKLPGTESRLDPPALVARVLFAGAAAGALARRRDLRSPVPAVLCAVGAALLAAKAGHDARAALSRHLPDSAVAVAEDGLALALAALACR